MDCPHSEQHYDFSETCNHCGSIMFDLVNGVYCDKGFFNPSQSVITDGMICTETGCKFIIVVIVRPQDCIKEEKINPIHLEQQMEYLNKQHPRTCSSCIEFRKLQMEYVNAVPKFTVHDRIME